MTQTTSETPPGLRNAGRDRLETVGVVTLVDLVRALPVFAKIDTVLTSGATEGATRNGLCEIDDQITVNTSVPSRRVEVASTPVVIDVLITELGLKNCS